MAGANTRSAAAWRTFLIGFGIIAVLFAAISRYPAALELAELKAFDLRMYARGARKPGGAVVIAAIDDKSIRHLGQWPWPRAVLGRLVSALKDYKAAMVGFDVVTSEPDAGDVARTAIAARLKQAGLSGGQIEAALGGGNDAAFARAIRDQGSTFMGFPFQSHSSRDGARLGATAGFLTSIVPPAPVSFGLVRQPPGAPPRVPTAPAYLPNLPIIASAAKGTAYFDIDTDRDAIIRSEMMVIKFQGRYFAPLVLALVSAWRGGAMLSLNLAHFGVAGVAVGSLHLPVDDLGRMLINFRGREGTFPHYPVVDIIEHRVPPEKLAGKIVLVGATAKGLGDRVATPFDAYFPGVEVHANAIDNILSGDLIRRSRLDAALERVAAFILGSAVAVAVAWMPASGSAAVALALGAGYLGVAQYLLVAHGLLIGILLPLASVAVTYSALASYRYFTEGLEKRHLRLAFEHYLHPQVIESLVDDPAALRLGGERCHLSVMFADIVNFTARAERSKPEDLVALLNAYMTVMTDVILQSGGVVDKLMGDGIMAFWGAPAKIENPARAAVDCALKMLEELKHLRERDGRFADLDIGIGIATGDAVVGNFGGQRRFDYSAIGDTVNLASRIEGLTRRFQVHLLVTLQTLIEAGGPYVARQIGLVKVKGKVQTAALVEVVGREGEVEAGYCEAFAKALIALRESTQTQACTQFRELAQKRPDDRVVQMYLERLNPDDAAPAAEIVFEFDTK